MYFLKKEQTQSVLSQLRWLVGVALGNRTGLVALVALILHASFSRKAKR